MSIIRNSSVCNCALAAQLAANALERPGIRPFAAGNFKMGGFRNSEAGRLNCYYISRSIPDFEKNFST